MLICSSYNNYSLIVILWKGNHDENKHGNSNTVDGSDKEKDDHTESKGSLENILRFCPLKTITFSNTFK